MLYIELSFAERDLHLVLCQSVLAYLCPASWLFILYSPGCEYSMPAGFFCSPDEFQPPPSPASECPWWLTFFPCPDQPQPLPSPASEHPLLVCFLLVPWPLPTSALSSKWVPLTGLLSFHILTSPDLCPLQHVSVPCWLTFFICPDSPGLYPLQEVSVPCWFTSFSCPDYSQPLPSLVCKCPLQAFFLSKVGLMRIHPTSRDKSDKKRDKHVNFELLYNDNIYWKNGSAKS